MTPKKVYWAMLGAILLLTLAILGGTYGVQVLLKKKSDELVSLKAKRSAYTAQQVNLVKSKKDIAEYTELYNISKSIVPENKNQAETVRQIVKLAAESEVALGSITFPSSTLGAGPGAKAPTSNNSLTSPTQKVNESRAALSQLTPVAGSPGVYVMQITVTSDGTQPASYQQIIAFLDSLERNRLTAEVTNVSITPAASSTNRFSFILNVNTYIKPGKP